MREYVSDKQHLTVEMYGCKHSVLVSSNIKNMEVAIIMEFLQGGELLNFV